MAGAARKLVLTGFSFWYLQRVLLDLQMADAPDLAAAGVALTILAAVSTERDDMKHATRTGALSAGTVQLSL